MAGFVNPNAFTNAFNTQRQLGAQMRQADQVEEMNALQLDQMRRDSKPRYDAQAFPKVGAIAAQISGLGDPAQKRAAFRHAITQNAPLFDTMGMPSTEALAKLDAADDATLDATLAKLATFAPRAAPLEVSAGSSLVQGDGKGGFTTAYTAPRAAGSDDGFSLSPGQVRFGSDGKEIARVAPLPEKPDTAAINTALAGLRDDFRNESKTFVGVADAMTRVQDSAADPSGAGDIALLYNYLKVLDPASTVREGEFQTVGSSGGLPTQVQAYFSKMIDGKLPPQLRADVLDRAQRLYRGQEKRYKAQILDRYRGLYKRAGGDPNDLGDQSATITPAPPGGGGSTPVRVNTPEEAAKLPPGTVFLTPDGRRKVVPGA